MTKLIYIADPMCSWCYGFGPELKTLRDGIPELRFEVIGGGLRAYNKELMDEALKTTLLSHWGKVEETTGLPFSQEALSHKNFIYDTEPACRAVVTARMLAPEISLDVFHAIQHGFYAEALDVTKGDVLAKISTEVLNKAGINISEQDFLATWSSEEAITTTNNDFQQTQRWGVTGFPTLVLEHAGELYLVTSGFARTEVLIKRLQALVDQTSDS
ncbi:DsbA family protein [Herminiimonas fonticola]|uniref:DSBA-like thioredoxin domain-containing protein n=1 Tax=Herminiimonas fonticola TaxID=303380 RepID=A0A4R6G6V4_9BURK|nr:DsbA family protein [Herminiimonas fonticola]RBA23113.1 putative protein-disulfide isomerase [Herminiimonas fonticola]TDN89445.1 putative protein-disulfide isomerase [Herminiimonas fonticola]